MKFKVGDNVRVREDLVGGNYYGGECFIGLMENGKGKVFEIKEICGKSYILGEDGFHWTDEMLEEVNRKIQEKTFREVIASIKEGEVWESVQFCFQLKEISCTSGQINFKLEGIFIDGDNNNNIFTGPGAGQTFKLQRKECTFQEAFKAYEEGKEIESCFTGTKYKFEKLIYFYKRKNIEDWQPNGEMQLNEIRSKWYINN